MRIADSAIQLYSQYTATEQHQKRESLLVWQNGRESKITEENNGKGREIDPEKEIRNQLKDKVSLSGLGEIETQHANQAGADAFENPDMIGDLNMRILQAFFERLTGRKFLVINPEKAVSSTAAAGVPAAEKSAAAPEANSDSAGYGLVYDYHESHYESEKTDFTAGGVITTADGKTLDFSVNLSMSREFYSEQSINIRGGDALKDPLVINFSGAAAQLTQRNFSFDIDADGTHDQIAFVAPGSGFLALDKNQDGQINDGGELFGTISGDGFGDLRGYDDDGNNWIDENDAIFQSLRIWSKNDEGVDQLIALGKAGIGALYLDHVATPFSIKDGENQLLGMVRETGLAIRESGQAVTMQHVDLVA